MIMEPLLAQIQAFPETTAQSLKTFCQSYQKAHLSKRSFEESLPTLMEYVEHVGEQLKSPYIFSHFHQKECWPFDFYDMARRLVKPLIDQDNSVVQGKEVLVSLDHALARGENVIFLANHQTEPDPQIISLMVEPYSRRIAQEMVSVAGHRVTTDPTAVPLSRGCNLLCIYSKKYIEYPPEHKAEKLQHNARSLAKLEELLSKGGTALYVAPSGGRDRWNEKGEVLIAPFDPQSVELFRLIAKKAKTTTHFHLLTLSTMHLLPPPIGTNMELGETRRASRGAVHLHFSEEYFFDERDQKEEKTKLRQERAEALTSRIRTTYAQFFTKVDV